MKLIEQPQGYSLEVDGTPWADLVLPRLGDRAPTVTSEALADGWLRVRLTWQVDAPIQQDELAVAVRLQFEPNFWWAPHLAPNEGDCIAQHAFRSPALIVSTPASDSSSGHSSGLPS